VSESERIKTALSRSAELIPSDLLASNSRFICRPANVDDSFGRVMVILPNDSGIAPGVCGVAGAHQQPLQFDKRRDIHARHALGHRSANDGIKHPVSDGNNNSRRTEDAQKSARRSLRYAPDNDLASKMGVPAVMDFQLHPTWAE
jgi:hypothetical protein